MKYVQVYIASKSTVINQVLTYKTSHSLLPGQVVRVPLKNRQIDAIVKQMVSKPVFQTKQISKVVDDAIVPIILLQMSEQIAAYYAAPLSQVVSLLLPRGVHINRRDMPVKSEKSATQVMQPLTKDQSHALKTISDSARIETVTLHGDTGTGKSRVYIELTKLARNAGLGSIILVPEIGLTTQLVNEFKTVFKDIFIQHSKMSERERHLQWQEILHASNPIVVGPRSAIFAPVNNLGLIIIDESHEPSYKQDQTPKYNTLRIAKIRSQLQKTRLILGSATPSVEDFYMAKNKDLPIVRMIQLATGINAEVDVKTIDLSKSVNRGKLITNDLKIAIEDALSNNQQSLIFHNRRGSSTSVICENCGDVAICPTCHIPLVHHHDIKLLKCHLCGYKESIKLNCNNCGHADLKYRGFGTKQIESQLIKMFPTAKIRRFDSDSPRRGSLDVMYKKLRDSKIDIIVGTQMVAKGLDLPNLKVVAVPLADWLLYLPDYSATERFFQLMYQVTGRVGRHQSGQVIVQTYNPTNPVIAAVLNRDYWSFYNQEITERREANYPPFVFMLSLICRRKRQITAEAATAEFASKIAMENPTLDVLGPTPAWHERTKQGYRWQLIVKSTDRAKLLNIVSSLPINWQFDIDPINLLR